MEEEGEYDLDYLQYMSNVWIESFIQSNSCDETYSQEFKNFFYDTHKSTTPKAVVDIYIILQRLNLPLLLNVFLKINYKHIDKVFEYLSNESFEKSHHIEEFYKHIEEIYINESRSYQDGGGGKHKKKKKYNTRSKNTRSSKKTRKKPKNSKHTKRSKRSKNMKGGVKPFFKLMGVAFDFYLTHFFIMTAAVIIVTMLNTTNSFLGLGFKTPYKYKLVDRSYDVKTTMGAVTKTHKVTFQEPVHSYSIQKKIIRGKANNFLLPFGESYLQSYLQFGSYDVGMFTTSFFASQLLIANRDDYKGNVTKINLKALFSTTRNSSIRDNFFVETCDGTTRECSHPLYPHVVAYYKMLEITFNLFHPRTYTHWKTVIEKYTKAWISTSPINQSQDIVLLTQFLLFLVSDGTDDFVRNIFIQEEIFLIMVITIIFYLWAHFISTMFKNGFYQFEKRNNLYGMFFKLLGYYIIRRRVSGEINAKIFASTIETSLSTIGVTMGMDTYKFNSKGNEANNQMVVASALLIKDFLYIAFSNLVNNQKSFYSLMSQMLEVIETMKTNEPTKELYDKKWKLIFEARTLYTTNKINYFIFYRFSVAYDFFCFLENEYLTQSSYFAKKSFSKDDLDSMLSCCAQYSSIVDNTTFPFAFKNVLKLLDTDDDGKPRCFLNPKYEEEICKPRQYTFSYVGKFIWFFADFVLNCSILSEEYLRSTGVSNYNNFKKSNLEFFESKYQSIQKLLGSELSDSMQYFKLPKSRRTQTIQDTPFRRRQDDSLSPYGDIGDVNGDIGGSTSSSTQLLDTQLLDTQLLDTQLLETVQSQQLTIGQEYEKKIIEIARTAFSKSTDKTTVQRLIQENILKKADIIPKSSTIFYSPDNEILIAYIPDSLLDLEVPVTETEKCNFYVIKRPKFGINLWLDFCYLHCKFENKTCGPWYSEKVGHIDKYLGEHKKERKRGKMINVHIGLDERENTDDSYLYASLYFVVQNDINWFSFTINQFKDHIMTKIVSDDELLKFLQDNQIEVKM